LEVRQVSIPHRYGKNHLLKRCLLILRIVSIPHRYGKNVKSGTYELVGGTVSIPHRYGKNILAPSQSLYDPMFPFLIGTVRTEFIDFVTTTGILEFPFLIGTVRTVCWVSEYERYEMFPFLIGTVRTHSAVTIHFMTLSFHSS